MALEQRVALVEARLVRGADEAPDEALRIRSVLAPSGKRRAKSSSLVRLARSAKLSTSSTKRRSWSRYERPAVAICRRLSSATFLRASAFW